MNDELYKPNIVRSITGSDSKNLEESEFARKLDHSSVMFRHLGTLEGVIPAVKSIDLFPINMSSYGCSTGQEVFSFMILAESIHGKNKSVVEANGYDISSREIEIASSGILKYGDSIGMKDYAELVTKQSKIANVNARDYDSRARFGSELGIKFSDWLTPNENGFDIESSLLKSAHFKVQDITETFIEEPRRDFIFAMAVMYFFNEEGVVRILRNVDRNLKVGGYFVGSGNDGVYELLMDTKRYEQKFNTLFQKIADKN